MRAPLATMALLAALAGCSAEPALVGNQTATAAPPPAATPAAPALPTGEEGVRRYAECASTLQAVGNLYSAIASQSTGTEQETFLNKAGEDQTASLDFQLRANQLSLGVPNSPPDHVPQLMSARREHLEQERARQPFEDFAVWLGREADQCAAIAPPASR